MTRRAGGAALLVLLAAACHDGGGPTAGELVVSLTGTASVRAVQLRVVGPVDAVSAPAGSGLIVYAATVAGDTQAIAVVAPAGATLAPGPIVQLQVPDVGRVGRYTASVLQAAGPTYALLATAGLGATVARP